MDGIPQGIRKSIRTVAVVAALAWMAASLWSAYAKGADDAAPAADANARAEQPAAGWQPRANVASSADAPSPAPQAPKFSEEKFVPGTSRYLAGAVLEMRQEATVIGGDVKLRQICRWCNADKAAFEPIADLVLVRMPGNVPFRSISLDELKQTLSDAGVNLGVIRLAGATACTIQRSDAQSDPQKSLEQWIEARQQGAADGAATPTTAAPATTQTQTRQTPVLAQTDGTSPSPAASAASVDAGAGQAPRPDQPLSALPKRITPPLAHSPVMRVETATPPPPQEYPSLRQLLCRDLADRLGLDEAAVQVRFNPQDEHVLSLGEPLFRFNIDSDRARHLGDVHWDVTIVAESGSKKLTISALARAWQNQIVLTRPLTYHQIIRDEDLEDRRALVESLGEDLPLKRSQISGQMAGRDLRAGTIMTARLIEAVPLVRTGQLVTVTVELGNVQVKSVARAMENGAYGQTIRVRNESTRDVLEVICCGPQEARMSSVGPVAKPGPSGMSASVDDGRRNGE